MLLAAPPALSGAPNGLSISRDWLSGIPENNQLAYEIILRDKRVGFQSESFSYDEDGNLIVDIYININLKFGFIPLFRYLHASREVWRDGQLISLNSKTDNNGDDEFVSIERQGAELVGRGTKVSNAVSEAAISTSYFNPNFVDQDKLLSSQDGRILNVDIEALGVETVQTPNGPVEAVHHRLAGELKLDIWYSRQGQWIRSTFKIGKQEVRIEPVKVSDLPSPDRWKRP